MAAGDRQLAFTTGSVPTSLQVSGPDRLTPKAVNATFDGYAAAVPFLPCLIITGPTGLEVARVTAPEIAAGASADVSWFPRVASAGGGGGGAVTAREQIQSAAVTTIAGHGADWLNWDTRVLGSVLFDLTNPQFPTVIADGVYAITITAWCLPMTVGSHFYLQLAAGFPEFPQVVATSGQSITADKQPRATCSLTYFLTTGTQVFAYVQNSDAVPVDFFIALAVVQQIS